MLPPGDEPGTNLSRTGERSRYENKPEITPAAKSAATRMTRGTDSCRITRRILVAAHPVRERLVAALMRALVAAGRDTEALLVYQRTREALADALGVDPSPELSALHVALLRGELGRREETRMTDDTAGRLTSGVRVNLVGDWRVLATGGVPWPVKAGWAVAVWLRGRCQICSRWLLASRQRRTMMAGYLTARRPGNLRAAGLPSSADASAARPAVRLPARRAGRLRAGSVSLALTLPDYLGQPATSRPPCICAAHPVRGPRRGLDHPASCRPARPRRSR